MGQGTDSCGGYELYYDEYEENLTSGVWIQKNGIGIKVSDMQTSHIKNTLRLVNGLAATSSFTSEQEKWEEWIGIFEDELSRRVGITSKPKSKTPPKPSRGIKSKMVCHCGKHYEARDADLKRGWGLSCSKSCAASRKTFHLPSAKKLIAN